MNNYSPLKMSKVLFLILIVFTLMIVFILILLSFFTDFGIKVPHPINSNVYPANIDYEPISSYGIYNPDALTNPNIGAVDINMNWFVVEPQQGVFNFAPADIEAAAWAKQGKKFTLIVRYINEPGDQHLTNCKEGQFLPFWEISRIQHFCDTDKGTIIPNYFDPTFKADLKAYVQAIANHFAQSPYRNSLAYVRVGVGLAGEGFYLMPCGDIPCDFATDKAQLVSWGYSPVVWRNWQEELMSSYQMAFSYTTVIYPIVQLDTDPTTGQPVQMEVAYWAAANGMGVGEQGLVPFYPYNYAYIKTILASIQSDYPNTYIQFQTNGLVASADEVQGDIQTANQLGAKSIEWYSDDAVDPSYQSLFQQWQQIVDSKFAGS